MWLPRNLKHEVCAVLMLITMGEALLIVGPKSLRANRDYTVVVSNFDGKVTKADILVRLEGHDDDGQTLLSLNKSVGVKQNANEIISFQIPPIITAGNFKIVIEGVNSFIYRKEVEVEYIHKSIAGLIQLSKPVYKPGDNVQFRVIVLDRDLKPPSDTKTVAVTVQDSVGNNIRKWSDAPLYNGVFEGQFYIATSPLLGTYNIKVDANYQKLGSKAFEVKEYVVSTFEVKVNVTEIPLEEHQALNLTIVANNYLGVPVVGTIKLQLYDEKRILGFPKEWDVNGTLQIHLPFDNKLAFSGDHYGVTLNVTFTEKFTNRTVFQKHHFAVYKGMYQVRLLGAPVFHAAPSNGFKLAIEYRDGKPVNRLTVKISIAFKNTVLTDFYTTDNVGIITIERFNSFSSANELEISISHDETVFFKTTLRKADPISRRLKIRTQTRNLSPENPFRLMVRCTHKMTFVLYYIVSKGNIVYSFSKRVDNKLYSSIELPHEVVIKMVPRSTILVATVIDNTFVYDIVTVNSELLTNNTKLELNEDKHGIRPDNTLYITVTGRPKTYVALAAYDRRLLQQGEDHTIGIEILKLFDEPDDTDAFFLLKDIGLFIRANGLRIEDAVANKSSRTSMMPNHDRSSHQYPTFRTNFLESWLWENITLPTNGSSTLKAAIPDTTTAWCLTGFSIDPVYGFEIIEKPLQFSTSLPFYIVDNLPYSIKRGEVVALHFTLLNALGAEYMADVTMFNVRDELEFIGQPFDAKNYTKTISVPPNVGYPISFLVKAKKLGDVTVRVKASMMQGQRINDAIERVIKVTPESLMQHSSYSTFFYFAEANSQTYEIVVDINRKCDSNSIKIDFSLTPNMLTDMSSEMQNLLSVSAGSGEDNMVRFVPNIVMLDYLTAIGSKETDVIKKAKEYLERGFQNQMNYRQTDGSFGALQSSGGSVFLTAFVAKSMQTAAKYIYVNEDQVSRAYDWLSSKQQSSGRFVEVGSIAHRDMQGGLRNGIALTAYAMIAFLENEQQATRHRTVVERGMKYIADNLEGMTDSYDLAIATYALWLNKHGRKSRALDKLIGLSHETANGTQLYWPRSEHAMETTAYALLSFVEAGRFVDSIKISRWLAIQRYTTGSFPHTQGTFVGLKALTKLSQKISPSNNEYDLQLTIGNTTKEYRFDSSSIEQFNMNNLPETTRQITVNIFGQGSGFIQVTYSYLLNLVNFKRSFILTINKMDTDSEAVLKLRVCTSFIPKLWDRRSNMALVEVNLPSGYVTETGLIVEEPGINPIKKREIRYGSTTAVLYYDNMGIENNCFTIAAHKRIKETIKRPSYVTVHDYYQPDNVAIETYEIGYEEVCDVCAEGKCPPSCSYYI